MDHGLNELSKLLKAQQDDHIVQIGHLRRLRNESAILGRKIRELESRLEEQEKFIAMIEKQIHTLEDKEINRGLKSIQKEGAIGTTGVTWIERLSGCSKPPKS